MVARGKARGFTLMELMIVVVIISILATVAVVSFGKYKQSARLNEGVAGMNDIRIKQETFFNTYSRYLSSDSDEDTWDGDLQSSNHLQGLYLWDVTCPTAGEAWCDLGFDPPRHEFDGNNNYMYFQWQTQGWGPGVDAPSYILDENTRWLGIRARGLGDSTGKFCSMLQMTNAGDEIVTLGQQPCE